jgi:hypothetical protein
MANDKMETFYLYFTIKERDCENCDEPIPCNLECEPKGEIRSEKENIKPKSVKDRDDLDLLELVCQLHYRAIAYQTKEMHDAFMEAKLELESRFASQQVSLSSDELKRYNSMLLYTFSVHDNEDGEDLKDRTYMSLKANSVDEARMKLIECYGDTITDILFLNNSIPLEIPEFNYPKLSQSSSQRAIVFPEEEIEKEFPIIEITEDLDSEASHEQLVAELRNLCKRIGAKWAIDRTKELNK